MNSVRAFVATVSKATMDDSRVLFLTENYNTTPIAWKRFFDECCEDQVRAIGEYCKKKSDFELWRIELEAFYADALRPYNAVLHFETYFDGKELKQKSGSEPKLIFNSEKDKTFFLLKFI